MAALLLWREALCGLDWLALMGSTVYLGRGVAHGDGSPVIVVPGLFASDGSLTELHDWLGRIGYRPYFSGIGRASILAGKAPINVSRAMSAST